MPTDVTRLRRPPPTVPVINKDGTMHPEWYRYFVELDRIIAALAA